MEQPNGSVVSEILSYRQSTVLLYMIGYQGLSIIAQLIGIGLCSTPSPKGEAGEVRKIAYIKQYKQFGIAS